MSQAMSDSIFPDTKERCDPKVHRNLNGLQGEEAGLHGGKHVQFILRKHPVTKPASLTLGQGDLQKHCSELVQCSTSSRAPWLGY